MVTLILFWSDRDCQGVSLGIKQSYRSGERAALRHRIQTVCEPRSTISQVASSCMRSG